MKVSVLCDDERSVIEKLWVAARTCYSMDDQWTSLVIAKEKTNEDMLKLIHHCIQSGHMSVIEHQNITFFIEGISRALSLQLARHRHLSISQKSQRYCKENEFDYVIPDSIIANPETASLFVELMKKDAEVYNKLVDLGVKPEDARAVLPNACTTNMTITMNLREFLHICNERMCTLAQAEIRKLVIKMANEMSIKLPFMAQYFVPKCGRLGYCTESSTRTCGRMPVKTEVINKDNK